MLVFGAGFDFWFCHVVNLFIRACFDFGEKLDG